MKKSLLSIFNNPRFVSIISLVIAIGIGAALLWSGQPAANAQYAKAEPAAISLTGQATNGTTSLALAFTTSGQIAAVQVKPGVAVHKGDVLATLDPQNTAGGLTEAKAAYDAAVANYQKVINGASGPAIDLARTALASATSAQTDTVTQQNLLVDNAYTTLLNTSPVAYPKDPTQSDQVAPTISGSYTLHKEGDIVIQPYGSASLTGYSINISGLVSGTVPVSPVTPEPLGDSGLYIEFPAGFHGYTTWIVSIPNQKSSNYIVNYDAYQAALTTRTQALAAATAAVNQAQSNLNVVASAARPEDVAAAQAQIENAQGALQIAQAAYDARRIIAPGDGTITAVHITAGQVASVNAPAIEMSGSSFSKDAAVTVPNSAVFEQNGKSYVRVRTGSGTVLREVTTGIRDNLHTEIVSGLAVGDEVAINP